MPVFLYLRWAPWPFMVSALSVCLWMARNVSAWRKSPIHYWKITLTMRYIIDELPWASLAFNVLQYRLVKSSESQPNCLISSIHPVNYAIFILEFSCQKRDFFFGCKIETFGLLSITLTYFNFSTIFPLFFQSWKFYGGREQCRFLLGDAEWLPRGKRNDYAKVS